MQEYIITNTKGECLYYDKYKKLCKTSNKYKAATFKTKGKAYRTLNCSFSKNKRNEWSVEEKKSGVSRKNKFDSNYSKTKSFSNDAATQRYRSETNTEFDIESKPDWDTVPSQKK